MPVNTTGIIISSQHATRYYSINNWALCEQVMQRPFLAGDTDMTPEMAEHAQKSCEQALQHTTAEYSQGYRMIMQERLAEHQQQMVILEHMLTESAA